MAMKSERNNAHVKSGMRFPLRNCLILLAVLCFTLMACGGPNYIKPGSEGQKPPKEVAPGYSISINTPLPLVCDKAYKITVKVTQRGVKCQGYNFTQFFNKASDLATAQKKALAPSCPKECNDLKELKTAMTWQCVDNMASLILQVSLICHTKDAKLPEEHNPSAEELAQNNFTFNPASDNFNQETDLVIIKDIHDTLPCPDKELYQVYYKEVLANFATLINPKDCSSAAQPASPVYQAYAKRGKDLAKEHYDSFTCPTTPPCEKVPFEVFRQEWDCDPTDKAVVVRTWFYVECKQKK